MTQTYTHIKENETAPSPS